MGNDRSQWHPLVKAYEAALTLIEENRDHASFSLLIEAYNELNSSHLPAAQLLPLPSLVLKSASKFTSTYPLLAQSLCTSAGALMEIGAPLTEEAGFLFADLLATMIKIEGIKEGDLVHRALDRMAPPSAHFLSLPRVRLSLHQDPEVMALLDDLRYSSSGIKMLHMMVNAPLDEPLVVLHLEEQKGFLVRISGVADNSQLIALLMDCLCGLPENQGLQGSRPSEEIVEVYTSAEAPQRAEEWLEFAWQPCLWSRTFCSSRQTDCIVWGEGVPFDIIRFRGQRVLLLFPPTYSRSFSTVRTFKPLGASVRVEKVLGPEEVQRWFEDFQASTPEEREEAIAEADRRNNMSPELRKAFRLIPISQFLNRFGSGSGSEEEESEEEADEEENNEK